MKRIYFLVSFCFCITLLHASDQTRLLRFPALHGDKLVFTYAGDLYLSDVSGGEARKITNAAGVEMFAKFSPDGSQIAFTANYDGNTEVYVMPALGGEPKRLTYTATLSRDDISDRMGPNNIVMGWTPDGKNVVYRSRKQTFNDFIGQLFTVPVEGGMSVELPLPAGGWCSYSADGKRLAYNQVFREFRTWKYYRGGMADDVYIYDFQTKETQNITHNDAQDFFPMWYGDRIFFVSDRDRTANIFVYDLRSKQTEKLTQYTDYDVKFPSAGDKAIVYEHAGDIWCLDVEKRTSRKIDVRIHDDGLAGRDVLKNVSGEIRSVDVSPDGKRLTVSAHGDVFSVPVKSGITRNLTQSSGAHDRDATWSPDGNWIAFLSDRSGEYEIYIQKQDGSEPAIQLTSGADTYKFDVRWSPDSKKILWNDKKMRLQYVDVKTKTVSVIAQSSYWEYSQFDWSPDSRWVAFSETAPNRFSRIVLYNIEKKTRTAVTDSWYDSNQPLFSRDGKYLFFVSDRDFHPTYSAVEWNYAYSKMSRIYAVALSAATPSPFIPVNDEVKVAEKTPSTADTKAGKDDDKKKTAQETKKDDVNTRIDTTGLATRIFDLPIPADRYYNLQYLNNKLYYSRSGTLYLYDLDKRKETEIEKGVGYTLTASGEKMLIWKGNDYWVIDTPSAHANLEEKTDMSGLTLYVNRSEEWRQIYDECWRQMRDFFYVPTLHGVDWKAMHDKYAVLLPYAKTKDDVNYLIGELIGELSIGHAYISGGDRVLASRVQTGLLGAKISKDAKSGFFRIDSLLMGVNWNKALRSPLTVTGVEAKKGEYIVAVNGQPLDKCADIYRHLVGTVDRQVELQLNSKPSLTGARKVIVVPVASEAELYYYTWVQNNIRKVSEATNGQVGYIHVPDMSAEGLNEFVKYFYPQLNKKALIIDDRGNGGGNVSPMIIERLAREVSRANMVRNATVPSQTPDAAMLGPKVMLMNKYSASDGDLFPYGFKKHQLGKVIGTRSWGGVVGIRGSLPFVDGTDLRKPEFASYSSETGQWIIEGHGVDPDIVVENDPALEYAGIDEQLNKAIEVIIQELKNYKPLPPIPEGPDKSK
ncbi:MAG: PDZ domain-containing protein [Bacteroidales bacterium]|jgi:tricorn protease|nr:PDZ domain-containing protein [Bacteroidales bacterium]